MRQGKWWTHSYILVNYSLMWTKHSEVTKKQYKPSLSASTDKQHQDNNTILHTIHDYNLNDNTCMFVHLCSNKRNKSNWWTLLDVNHDNFQTATISQSSQWKYLHNNINSQSCHLSMSTLEAKYFFWVCLGFAASRKENMIRQTTFWVKLFLWWHLTVLNSYP